MVHLQYLDHASNLVVNLHRYAPFYNDISYRLCIITNKISSTCAYQILRIRMVIPDVNLQIFSVVLRILNPNENFSERFAFLSFIIFLC